MSAHGANGFAIYLVQFRRVSDPVNSPLIRKKIPHLFQCGIINDLARSARHLMVDCVQAFHGRA